jgi:hypothetical protein
MFIDCVGWVGYSLIDREYILDNSSALFLLLPDIYQFIGMASYDSIYMKDRAILVRADSNWRRLACQFIHCFTYRCTTRIAFAFCPTVMHADNLLRPIGLVRRWCSRASWGLLWPNRVLPPSASFLTKLQSRSRDDSPNRPILRQINLIQILRQGGSDLVGRQVCRLMSEPELVTIILPVLGMT